MALVVVEREFDQPAVFEELQAKEEAFAWCLEENGVRFLHTYFALDRRKMVCVYDAPDAEAVRRTQRTAKMPVAQLWPARSVMRESGRQPPPHDVGRAIVVVERVFPQPLTVAAFLALNQNGKWCFEANAVELIDSYINATSDGSLCIFAAPDAEAVRKTNRTLSYPADRTWSASFHAPA